MSTPAPLFQFVWKQLEDIHANSRVILWCSYYPVKGSFWTVCVTKCSVMKVHCCEHRERLMVIHPVMFADVQEPSKGSGL